MSAKENRAGECGFTLIELLVVIGIISILAGLIISFISTEPGKDAACKNNLRQIGLAFYQYQCDYGRYPWSNSPEPSDIFRLIAGKGRIDEPNMFRCLSCNQNEPDDYNEGNFILEPENVSYAVYAEPITDAAPSRTIMVADAHWFEEDNQGHPDHINVLQKSGAVVEIKLRPGDKWEEATGGKLKR